MNTPLSIAWGERVDLPSASVCLRGHLDTIRQDGVRPLRLPRDAWSRFPPHAEILRAIVSNASGVHLLLRTSARRLRLAVRCTRMDVGRFEGPKNNFAITHHGLVVATAPAPVDAVEHIDPAGLTASTEMHNACSWIEFTPLPEGDKTLALWLPPGMIVDFFDVQADAPVQPGVPTVRPRWVHHGSSISHCASTRLPTGTWPAVAADIGGLDLLNLGFGGQCMLDPFVADAIARTPVDVISLKVGVNIVGARSMDQRSFVPALHGFLDRVRQGHPKVPIVVCSSIYWPGSEDRPGPSDVSFATDGSVRCFTAGDPAEVAKGALTMALSRRHVADAVATRRQQGEPIDYLDGLTLYGPDDEAEFPLPDSLHPDDRLNLAIGHRFASAVFGASGLVPLAAQGPTRAE